MGELDPEASAALCWRQNHLPLHRLRRDRDWAALGSLETEAAWRVTSRLHLDDDQRHSLFRHHREQVETLAARARPDLAERSHRRTHSQGMERMARRMQRRRRWYRRPGIPSFTAGWACWFSNRQVGLRNRWFRLRTLPSYRGAPRLGP